LQAAEASDRENIMPSSKTKKTFEENRQELLVRMTAKADGDAEQRVVPFQNDDVPEFLKSLEEFEAQSRKTSIRIK
jgi:hypothetical protein